MRPSVGPAMTRESDLAAENQPIEKSASGELIEATEPGTAQEAPCEKSYSREDVGSIRQSQDSNFFDPIKDALHQ